MYRVASCTFGSSWRVFSFDIYLKSDPLVCTICQQVSRGNFPGAPLFYIVTAYQGVLPSTIHSYMQPPATSPIHAETSFSTQRPQAPTANNLFEACRTTSKANQSGAVLCQRSSSIAGQPLTGRRLRVGIAYPRPTGNTYMQCPRLTPSSFLHPWCCENYTVGYYYMACPASCSCRL